MHTGLKVFLDRGLLNAKQLIDKKLTTILLHYKCVTLVRKQNLYLNYLYKVLVYRGFTVYRFDCTVKCTYLSTEAPHKLLVDVRHRALGRRVLVK